MENSKESMTIDQLPVKLTALREEIWRLREELATAKRDGAACDEISTPVTEAEGE